MMDKSMNPTDTQRFKTESYGSCAGCGELTRKFDTKWQIYVCDDCNGDEIAEDIAHHVLYPND